MYFSTNAILASARHNSEIQNALVSKRRTLLSRKVVNRTFSGSLVLDVRIWWRRMHTLFADYVHNKTCFTTACKGLFRFLLDRISQRYTLYFVSVLLTMSFCNEYGKHRTRYCLIFWIGRAPKVEYKVWIPGLISFLITYGAKLLNADWMRQRAFFS